jgi:hypothetical protein
VINGGEILYRQVSWASLFVCLCSWVVSFGITSTHTFFLDFQGNTNNYFLFIGSIVPIPITDQSSVRARLVEAVWDSCDRFKAEESTWYFYVCTTNGTHQAATLANLPSWNPLDCSCLIRVQLSSNRSRWDSSVQSVFLLTCSMLKLLWSLNEFTAECSLLLRFGASQWPRTAAWAFCWNP